MYIICLYALQITEFMNSAKIVFQPGRKHIQKNVKTVPKKIFAAGFSKHLLFKAAT